MVVSGFINLRSRLPCGPKGWGLFVGIERRFTKDRGTVSRGHLREGRVTW